MDKKILKINELEIRLMTMSDADLSHQTERFRHRLALGETLDDLLCEAFATVREVSRRIFGKRHFDVQCKGAMVLHQGAIAEMKTGEGKTLVAAMAAYLNALPGQGIHVITVNDYLAQRDAHEMGQIYTFLGLSTGCILSQAHKSSQEKRHAYNCDITYGTNNEFGFDFLRDNMATAVDNKPDHTPLFETKIQRPFYYAIIDEIDSILIDEGRTPLIISGEARDEEDIYTLASQTVRKLIPEDYEMDFKSKSISLTEKGVQALEIAAQSTGFIQENESLFQGENIILVHRLQQALKAEYMFTCDVDYMVRNDEILIIDEFTGRILPGREYSEGLHQALQAKEDISITSENQTVASITFQNYFKLYPKLAGMTGTALTEKQEFLQQGLDVFAIPPNKPFIRKDHEDEIYRTFREKTKAIVDQIKICQEKQQPVLVGTVSVEKSELISQAFTQAGIIHEVLNARQNEREAIIMAEAGTPSRVTVATNMAGRGTDIQLGGNFQNRYEAAIKDLENPDDEDMKHKLKEIIAKEIQEARNIVLAAGGLYVLGTERHESRRIDNQLRGRCSRQGDPGEAKFYLCLEDDLMKLFGSGKFKEWIQTMGFEEGEVITHKFVSRAIQTAQKKIEAYNFEQRKYLLKYDTVLDKQRTIFYERRQEIMSSPHWSEFLKNLIDAVLTDGWHARGFEYPSRSWDWNHIEHFIQEHVSGLEISSKIWKHHPEMNATIFLKELSAKIWELIHIPEKSLKFIEKHQLNHFNESDDASEDEDEINEKNPNFENKEISMAVTGEIPILELDDGENSEQTNLLLYKNQRKLALNILDDLWRDHLHRIDYLRHSVHLLSYGQKDPLIEYQNKSFEIFELMLWTWQKKVLMALAQKQIQSLKKEEYTWDSEDYLDLLKERTRILMENLNLHIQEEDDDEEKNEDLNNDDHFEETDMYKHFMEFKHKHMTQKDSVNNTNSEIKETSQENLLKRVDFSKSEPVSDKDFLNRTNRFLMHLKNKKEK